MMYFVGVLCLVVSVIALPSTEHPLQLDITETNDQTSNAFNSKPANNEENTESEKNIPELSEQRPFKPSVIESLNKEADINKLEEQDAEKEDQEEQRLEDLASPNLGAENNEYNNAGIETEPIDSIYEINDEANNPIIFKPSYLSGLLSYLPSWLQSFPIRWPLFQRPFYRTSEVGYPGYPEYYIEE